MACNRFSAHYYDGRTSERWPVELLLDDQAILISGSGINLRHAYADARIEPPVGSLRGQIRFSDGSLCEVEDGQALMRALPKKQQQPLFAFIHQIENRLHYVAVVLLLAIAVVWGVIEYGIPIAARHVAKAIPLQVEQNMGAQVMTTMDRFVFKPSELRPQHRARLQHTFAEFIQQTKGRYRYQVEFRAAPKIGANAFALPGGRIVFTDDMVHLAEDERELLAVLAHEIGHVEQRHTMRHVLQDSITVILLVMLTGDIESATSLVATLPTLLVQAKFSRQFETEADRYAAGLLQRQGLSTQWLATILERLDDDKSDGVGEFLQSHPSTPNRIAELKRFSSLP